MKCCTAAHCDALEDIFDPAYALDELKAYRKNGPSKPTRALLAGLHALGEVNGATLLDIGGGVGAIPLDLMQRGLARATSVDASRAYLDVARQEAERRGFADRLDQIHGDFVTHAPSLDAHDFVTLDRVICCYPDMPALVRLAAERAHRAVAWVSPRDAWWMRSAARGFNLWERLQRSAYRFFVHPDAAVAEVLRTCGLRPHARRTAGVWQVNLWRTAT
jgi:magnesium-protoporphyrin O-methyltransferase